MPKIGPFFYLAGKLIYDAIPLSEGRRQADKLDNSLGHDELYDSCFSDGEYIDIPRGRVVWDCTNNRAIIYIDPCLKTEDIICEILCAFELSSYVIEEDEHYHCRLEDL